MQLLRSVGRSFGQSKLFMCVYGVEFQIQTDQSPLTWLQTMKDKNHKLVKWSLFLQQ